MLGFVSVWFLEVEAVKKVVGDWEGFNPDVEELDMASNFC